MFLHTMQEVTLIFPHQLFEHHPAIHPSRKVVMVEEWLFFSQYNFHRLKIGYHRATMRYYQDELKAKNYHLEYVESHHANADIRALLKHLHSTGTRAIHYCDVCDDWLEKRIRNTAQQLGLQLKKYDSPNFVCSESYLRQYFGDAQKFSLTKFYTDQRKRLHIMLDNGKPLGGKWTYDTENRKKMPEHVFVPSLPCVKQSVFTTEAVQYTNTHYSGNNGQLKKILYPTTHSEAKIWLQKFLEERFSHYGIYQDAIVAQQSYLFHAVLTPMLNVGLLNPDDILQQSIDSATEYKVSLNSLEGFVRQVLGWREYIRAIYLLKGVLQRNRNYWNNERKIPSSFYNGTTGIAPVDDAIKKLNATGYNHHIERLMILGNFMLLCDFHPHEVYRWFMEMYIDAYDWVMVPNVYGMSQFADGGMMSTKPYISSSNYVLKMSNYKTGKWGEVWDALYWRFIYRHKIFFASNPRMSVMVAQLNKKGDAIHEQIRLAENFLNRLH